MKQLRFGDWDIALKTDKLMMTTTRSKENEFLKELIILDRKHMIHGEIGLTNDDEIVVQPMTLKCTFQISYGKKEIKIRLQENIL
ncbi:hypothetical protein ACLBXI_07455 [Bacillus cereus]